MPRARQINTRSVKPSTPPSELPVGACRKVNGCEWIVAARGRAKRWMRLTPPADPRKPAVPAQKLKVGTRRLGRAPGTVWVVRRNANGTHLWVSIEADARRIKKQAAKQSARRVSKYTNGAYTGIYG
jgi:hypothetical protein